MEIKNIYCGDFGIFQNEWLKQLNSGINVIGGFNRSGKTTFMQILRYLGYGFPRDNSLPPAERDYHVEADLKEAENLYNLKLKGYGKPSLVVKTESEEKKGQGVQNSSQKIKAQDLYGNLDRFTYHRVFTVDLSELQSIPRDIEGEKMQERLYSVLMGAGISEIIELPGIVDDFNDRARKIGGKKGSPGVWEFKPYNKIINEAEEKKEQALKQIEIFQKKEAEIKKLTKKLEQRKEEINGLEEKKTRLDFLKNTYDDYTELVNLKLELTEHPGHNVHQGLYSPQMAGRAEKLLDKYEQTVKSLKGKKETWQTIIGENNHEKIKDCLLEHSANLEQFKTQLSGLREKVRIFLERKKEINERYNHIKNDLSKLGQDWAANPEQIKEVKIDLIEQDNLYSMVDKYEKAETRIQNKEEQLSELKQEVENIEQQLAESQPGYPHKSRNRALLGITISGILGGTAAVFNFLPGLFAGAGGLLLSTVYFFAQYHTEEQKQQTRNDLKNRQNSLELKINQTRDLLQKLKSRLKNIEKKLVSFYSQLGIEQKLTRPGLIKNHFENIRDVKRRYQELLTEREKLNKRKKKLLQELSEIRSILKNLENNFSDDIFTLPETEELIEESERIFTVLEKMIDYLDYAREIKIAERKKAAIEQKMNQFLQKTELEYKEKKPAESIENYQKTAKSVIEYRQKKKDYRLYWKQFIHQLTASDRTKNAFLNSKFSSIREIRPSEEIAEYISNIEQLGAEQKKVIDVFDYLFDQFSSPQEVGNEYEKTAELIEQIQEKKKELEKRISTLKKEKERISSPQDITEAHQEINAARTELRDLAERFAVNKSVSFILKKAQDRLLDRARKELLAPAGEIMEEITGGQYEMVEPAEKLGDPDFQVIRDDGKKINSTWHLSRGTREQLFLAVRISRIKDIEPGLPVILDDSLVNFDHRHLRQTAHILSRLKETHQLFVLTCHPHLVEHIRSSDPDASCWQLEQGNFTPVSGSDLINYLQNQD